MDSAKAVKAQEYKFLNAIHYLAPHDLSGFQLCPHASAGCLALCLGWESGQASMVKNDTDINSVRLSRIEKSRRFMRDRANYLKDVVRSIELAINKANRMGFRLCVRMNGSSDIAWEGIRINGKNLFQLFPDVAFVDYTKNAKRFDRALPANYHLTFSRSETNEADCVALLNRGVNVAVVFAGDKPQWWKEHPVIDGDLHDLRQLDPRGRGTVIALSPKGRKAKKDISGFVVR
jgi:hypothetical protein